MTYEEFYKKVVAVKDSNLLDATDFANDVLHIINEFDSQNAAQQSVQRTANGACENCGNNCWKLVCETCGAE